EPDLRPGAIFTIAPDVRNNGNTAAVAGYARKLGPDSGELAATFRIDGTAPRRPALLPVLVRTVSGVLGRLRGCQPVGKLVPCRWRNEQRRAVAPAHGKSGNCGLLYTDLRLAAGRSRGRAKN